MRWDFSVDDRIRFVFELRINVSGFLCGLSRFLIKYLFARQLISLSCQVDDTIFLLLCRSPHLRSNSQKRDREMSKAWEQWLIIRYSMSD